MGLCKRQEVAFEKHWKTGRGVCGVSWKQNWSRWKGGRRGERRGVLSSVPSKAAASQGNSALNIHVTQNSERTRVCLQTSEYNKRDG